VIDIDRQDLIVIADLGSRLFDTGALCAARALSRCAARGGGTLITVSNHCLQAFTGGCALLTDWHFACIYQPTNVRLGFRLTI
jgi:hypothetical protein